MLFDEMERALGRLRDASVRPDWRAEARKSAGVLARGVAGLLELADEKPEPALDAPALDKHARAQRFATVRVAEIQLYHGAQVKAGRSSGNLYGSLGTVLDLARRVYAEQFLTPMNGVPDYLHREVVRVLANNDATLLGPQYPGPLA